MGIGGSWDSHCVRIDQKSKNGELPNSYFLWEISFEKSHPPPTYETSARLVDGHYILTVIRDMREIKDFGIAHTPEEADRRLYSGIIQCLASIPPKFYDEVIDVTSHAEERLAESIN